MKIVGIIPARYGSTRFPGKPLTKIGDKTMIRRVYEQAEKTACLSKVVVATDDERIRAEVENFGGNVSITSSLHRSGTERCAEVLAKLEDEYQVVINIQGDEPFIDPAQIELLAGMFSSGEVEIATLSKKITEPTELQNPNTVKIVAGKDGKAIYFSRSPIPFLRGAPSENWIDQHDYFKHIGIYAYRSEILKKIVALPFGKLEQAESLEQLRWLENGFSIFVSQTESESISIDTPEDLAKIINI